MNNFFSKKGLLIIGFFGTLIQVISKYNVDLGICSSYSSKCNDVAYILTVYSWVFVPLFIFSLITYKLKQSTFDSWRKFSIWSIPLILIIITMLPLSTHGLDFVPVTKGTVVFFLTIAYSALSLILIAYKSITK